MVLLSSRDRGLALERHRHSSGRSSRECRSLPNPSTHHWISLPYNHIIGRKKPRSDETLRISNTKGKEHEPGQLQQAEQVHLVPLTPVPAMV